MRKSVLFLFLICFTFGNSQNKKLDSLLLILKTAREDTSKVLVYADLCKNYIFFGDYKMALQNVEKGSLLAGKLNYKKGILICLISSGVAYSNQQDYPKSYDCNLRAIKIAEETGDKKRLALCYCNIGANYFEQADYPKALDFVIRSLKIHEELGDKAGMSDCYSTIGAIYRSQSEFSEAINYTTRSLKIAEETKDKARMGIAYNHLGSIYYDLNNLSKALEYFKEELKFNQEINYRKGISAGFGNIGAIYKNLKKYEVALEYATKQLNMAEELKDKRSIVDALYNIGGIYIEFKKNKEALLCFEKTILLSKETGNPEDLLYAYKGILTVHYNTGNFKEAFNCSEKIKVINDSIFNIEKSEQLSEIKTKYETEKKEQENQLLQKTTQIQLLELNQNKLFIIALSALLLLVLALAYLLIRQNKFRNNQREMQLEQKLLRSQMNPHFIFNSLNSIHSVVLSGDPKSAAKYLASFSKLVRAILESSRFETISLEKEISLLHNYISLQILRFENDIKYSIDVEPDIDVENTALPPMLTQPFIENALEHGLNNIENAFLTVSFKKSKGFLKVEVIDNGVGLDHTNNNGQHISMATAITKERLQLLNRGKNKKTNFSISEAFPADPIRKGVKVTFEIPV